MIQLGFVNPQTQAVIFEVNIHTEDRITKITSYKDGLPTYTKLEGLKFSPAGILKQFPDLKDKEIPEMKRIALQRFKKHLQKMETERELCKYITEELTKTGYKLRQIIKPKHRPINVKDGKYVT